MFTLLLSCISVLFAVPVIMEPIDQAEVNFNASACVVVARPTLPMQANGALFWAV